MYYLDLLHEVFEQKQKINSRYSLRSYAKYLTIDSSSLSHILKGKRSIPDDKVEVFFGKINNYVDASKELFLKSIEDSKLSLSKINISDSKKKKKVDGEQLHILCDINTYAVLGVLDLNMKFKTSLDIAKILNIPREDINVSLDKLMKSGIVTKEVDGYLKRKISSFDTYDDIPNESLRQLHRDAMQEASVAIEEIELKSRYFSSLTIPSNIEKMNGVKKLFREFEDKVESYLESAEDKSDLLRMNIQLYPLSNINR